MPSHAPFVAVVRAQTSDFRRKVTGPNNDTWAVLIWAASMIRRFAFVLCAMFACCTPAFAAEPDSPKSQPQPLTRKAIEALVTKHLRANALYMPGDLISQGDVEPVFNELIENGYRSPDMEGLYDSFLPDRDHFVKSMRTPEGRMFMRSIARLPGAYDRLERLSWSETGRSLLAELLASKDGKKALEHMLTEEGAKVVETILANDPRGRNFQLPTGKVHTANELIDHLSAMFVDAAAQ